MSHPPGLRLPSDQATHAAELAAFGDVRAAVVMAPDVARDLPVERADAPVRAKGTKFDHRNVAV